MKPVTLLTAILLDLVAFAHVLRLVFHTEVMIGTRTIPMSVSVVGIVVPAALSILLIREARIRAA